MRHRLSIGKIAAVTGITLWVATACSSGPGKSAPSASAVNATATRVMPSAAKPAAPAHDTLERKIMVGYQGWFRTPDDGAGMGWMHYRGRGGVFGPGSIAVDYWPDVSELTAAERVDTAFTYEDGSKAQVFSSHHPLTVDRHFKWMQEYGIDGAFVQRFAAPLVRNNAVAQTHLRATDDVMRYAQAAAEHHGRSFVVMYDLSGMPQGAMEQVMRDWKHVVDDLKVRASPAYQHQGGKPLIAVWGIGFNDGRAYTLEECAALIRFLKNDPVYGGNTVMLGIPSWWREQTNDATRDPQLHQVLQLGDILSPWTPGRYSDLGGIRLHVEKLWLPDRAWCEAHGLGYMPVVFPGFSWRNLKHVTGGIDRLDGRFLWEQYRAVANHGFTMVYQAMFDEMDEGTQIFKVSNHPPPGAELLTYRPLPNDYYLRLVGLAGNLFRAAQPFPERIPEFPGAPEITRYLRLRDDAIYQAVDDSAEAQRRFAALGGALHSVARGEWASAGDPGTRVRVTGNWDGRFLHSSDPQATMEWELAAPVSAREFFLSVRCPSRIDPDASHAARLRVWQGGTLLATLDIDLAASALRWREVTRLRLAPGPSLRLVLDQPTPSPSSGEGLILFEPRLLPGN